ncbi:hypothetical protein B9Z55_022688 [Caenorhabditis nigoni]|uniref:Uncharacterized protein n=1 Tax=Caenorhabditis nigoni TaxID=1611254 RepID=A0A2G5SL81_9PELO|nr:hypothetical protein B9Z55_022688 [Caenorhabditis nigoni]
MRKGREKRRAPETRWKEDTLRSTTHFGGEQKRKGEEGNARNGCGVTDGKFADPLYEVFRVLLALWEPRERNEGGGTILRKGGSRKGYP